MMYRHLKQETHLDDLPATCQFIVELFLHSCDHRGIVTLLHLVFGTDDNFPRLGISEDDHLLCDERDHENWDLIFKDFAL